VSLEEVFPHSSMDGAEDDVEQAEYQRQHMAHETAKFKAADKNSDGFLDKDEFGAFEFPEIDDAVEDAYARSIFESKDTDKDGSLTLEEFYPHDAEDMPHEDFKKLDKNGDSVISFQEFANGLKGMGLNLTNQEEASLMKRFDHNGDGVISMEEFYNTLANSM